MTKKQKTPVAVKLQFLSLTQNDWFSSEPSNIFQRQIVKCFISLKALNKRIALN